MLEFYLYLCRSYLSNTVSWNFIFLIIDTACTHVHIGGLENSNLFNSNSKISDNRYRTPLQTLLSFGPSPSPSGFFFGSAHKRIPPPPQMKLMREKYGRGYLSTYFQLPLHSKASIIHGHSKCKRHNL